MDNLHFDITGELGSDMESAFMIATRGGRRTAVGYKILEKRLEKIARPGRSDIPIQIEKTLVFYWVTAHEVQMLPFELDVKGMIDFTTRWLGVNPPVRPEPDHDGDNGKGFRIWCDSWGHVNSEYQAFVAIKPEWACYGK